MDDTYLPAEIREVIMSKEEQKAAERRPLGNIILSFEVSGEGQPILLESDLSATQKRMDT